MAKNQKEEPIMKNKKTLTMRIQREDNLNTVIYDDIVGAGNGRHYYEVERNGKTLAEIQFQHGARNEQGSTAGVLETDLLEIVRHRLQCFQDGEYKTRENACALMHIEEALMWLNKRVVDRKERGVLGTMKKLGGYNNESIEDMIASLHQGNISANEIDEMDEMDEMIKSLSVPGKSYNPEELEKEIESLHHTIKRNKD